MVSHEVLDVAVHEHPELPLTVTMPVVAVANTRFTDVGVIVNVHGAPG